MKDKSNIDNLFHEGFKNFEATPSPRVWENIQTELNKEKRNRKPIPLWIKYGGVAALLALLLTVGNWVFNLDESVPNGLTNENIVDSVEKSQKGEDGLNVKFFEKQVAIEYEDTQNESTEAITTVIDNTGKTKNGQQSNEKPSKAVIASSNSEKSSSEEKENPNEILKDGKHQKTNTNKGMAVLNNASVLPANGIDKTMDGQSEKEQIINNDKVIFEKTAERNSIADKSGMIEEKSVKTEIAQISQNKKSIMDAIAENEETNEEVTKIEKQKPEHRWNVTPNVAPVYYSSFGNGSSIDPDFSNNPQKGDVNMSYGLQVSYSLGQRLSIRTGVNNVDLSYSTSDIVLGTGPVSRGLPSVDYGSQQIVVTALNSSSLANNAPSNGFGEITLKSTSGDARLIQNINYYEVPLELKYAVIDNKFGINLIGGVSTLFLGSNEISVKSDNFSSVLGEANNLSSVSFSTNVGLGMDYKLSKKFVFNIEPMFKYQLNPYTDSSVNFKPYYLGVYSGLSFKF